LSKIECVANATDRAGQMFTYKGLRGRRGGRHRM